MDTGLGHFFSVRDDIPEDFRIAYERLHNENERVVREREALLASNVALEKANANLRRDLLLALRLRHAYKSEKWTANDKQLALILNEAEQFAPPHPLDSDFQAKLKEAVTETPKNSGRKKSGRKAIDPLLPREEIVVDVAPEAKTCACGQALQRIGEDTREQFDYVPARLRVLRTVYPKYACVHCQGLADVTKPAVVSAEREPEILPRSNATISMLVYIAVSKFMDHLPLYRLERVFARLNIILKRATMSLWMVAVGRKLLRLVALMRADMMRCDYIGGDAP